MFAITFHIYGKFHCFTEMFQANFDQNGIFRTRYYREILSQLIETTKITVQKLLKKVDLICNWFEVAQTIQIYFILKFKHN